MAVIALSDEAQVMMAPRAAYRRLVAAPPRPGLAALLRRPALAALVIGGAVALTSTGGATALDLVTTTVCWSFVPGLQLLVAAILIALVRRRSGLRLSSLRLSSALDLFFAGQGPWLLWMLGVAVAALIAFRIGGQAVPQLRYVLLLAIVPLVWTWVIVFAFCRAVLGLGGRRALAWTALYQAAIWGLAYLYVGGMTFQAWPFGQMRL